ncbi:MAG: hypothetical protein B7733_20090 [Myxococcales bacterium FL481]|nr:MAG: hypothetical protein B7733_20090 [Myxococcales bacterium FL481]
MTHSDNGDNEDRTREGEHAGDRVDGWDELLPTEPADKKPTAPGPATLAASPSSSGSTFEAILGAPLGGFGSTARSPSALPDDPPEPRAGAAARREVPPLASLRSSPPSSEAPSDPGEAESAPRPTIVADAAQIADAVRTAMEARHHSGQVAPDEDDAGESGSDSSGAPRRSGSRITGLDFVRAVTGDSGPHAAPVAAAGADEVVTPAPEVVAAPGSDEAVDAASTGHEAAPVAAPGDVAGAADAVQRAESPADEPSRRLDPAAEDRSAHAPEPSRQPSPPGGTGAPTGASGGGKTMAIGLAVVASLAIVGVVAVSGSGDEPSDSAEASAPAAGAVVTRPDPPAEDASEPRPPVSTKPAGGAPSPASTVPVPVPATDAASERVAAASADAADVPSGSEASATPADAATTLPPKLADEPVEGSTPATTVTPASVGQAPAPAEPGKAEPAALDAAPSQAADAEAAQAVADAAGGQPDAMPATTGGDPAATEAGGTTPNDNANATPPVNDPPPTSGGSTDDASAYEAVRTYPEAELLRAPAGTEAAAARVFASRTLVAGDRPPLGAVGTRGVHIDRIMVGTKRRGRGCETKDEPFKVGVDAEVVVCFRVILAHKGERLTLKWRHAGETKRRAFLPLNGTRVRNGRVRMPVRPQFVGDWELEVSTRKGHVLATTSFAIAAP